MKKMGYTHDKPKNEAHDPKHVKQAVGIASDPRYKGGNMTGATKVINKLSKGLSDHPQVKAVLKRQNEGLKTFAEISKGMAGRYIKKAQVSTADAAKSTERGYTDSRSQDRDISKAGKDQAKKGIKTFINRNKGTSTAVNKLTGKAKVPAKEGMAQGIVKQKISREKDMDAKRHDRMMDRARTSDTKKKNMSETLDHHKKALDHHRKMRDAHMHADDHDPGDTPHYKSAEHHGDAAIQHSYIIDRMKKDKNHPELKDRVANAHKQSIKANKHTSTSHSRSKHDPKFRSRFDDHLKNNGGTSK
jgi:hypothetical protein